MLLFICFLCLNVHESSQSTHSNTTQMAATEKHSQLIYPKPKAIFPMHIQHLFNSTWQLQAIHSFQSNNGESMLHCSKQLLSIQYAGCQLSYFFSFFFFDRDPGLVVAMAMHTHSRHLRTVNSKSEGLSKMKWFLGSNKSQSKSRIKKTKMGRPHVTFQLDRPLSISL